MSAAIQLEHWEKIGYSVFEGDTGQSCRNC